MVTRKYPYTSEYGNGQILVNPPPPGKQPLSWHHWNAAGPHATGLECRPGTVPVVPVLRGLPASPALSATDAVGDLEYRGVGPGWGYGMGHAKQGALEWATPQTKFKKVMQLWQRLHKSGGSHFSFFKNI